MSTEHEPAKPIDPDIEAAWMEEVERRAAEVDSGKVKMISREEFMESLRSVTER